MGDLLKIYTDGACSQNGTWDAAYAFNAWENDIWIYSEGGYIGQATNNIAELEAVLNALKFASSWIKNAQDQVVINSDSAYIVNCVNQKWYAKWKKNGWVTTAGTPVQNKEYWVGILHLLEEYPNITFVKVAGHANDKGNNMADADAVFCMRNKTHKKEML